MGAGPWGWEDPKEEKLARHRRKMQTAATRRAEVLAERSEVAAAMGTFRTAPKTRAEKQALFDAKYAAAGARREAALAKVQLKAKHLGGIPSPAKKTRGKNVIQTGDHQLKR